jgi:hypothetical protein
MHLVPIPDDRPMQLNKKAYKKPTAFATPYGTKFVNILMNKIIHIENNGTIDTETGK